MRHNEFNEISNWNVQVHSNAPNCTSILVIKSTWPFKSNENYEGKEKKLLVNSTVLFYSQNN